MLTFHERVALNIACNAAKFAFAYTPLLLLTIMGGNVERLQLPMRP